MSEETGLVKQEPAGLPAPVFSGAQMATALTRYKELQTALDVAMPDQIQVIGKGEKARSHRKKGYWRAVSTAFNLVVRCVKEERIEVGFFDDQQPNFGYLVTYEAEAPGGRIVTGDGACTAVEKAGKFFCPHPKDPRKPTGYKLHYPAEQCPLFDPHFAWRRLPENATEHNVRSHAHTRAYNRAISNLVGFGEVSAEEVDRDGNVADAAPQVEEQPIEAQGHAVQGEVVEPGIYDDAPHPAELENEPPPPAPAAQPRPGPRPAPPQAQARPANVAPRPAAPTGPRPVAARPAAPAARPAPQQAARPQQGNGGGPNVISTAQDRRLFAIAMQHGWDAETLNGWLAEVWNIQHSSETPRKDYNSICAALEQGPPRV
jgi:hypothetical protein